MQDEGRWKIVDGVGSVAVGVILLVMGGWCGWEVLMLPRQVAMFAEIDSTELPHWSRLMFGLGELGVLRVLAMVLLLGGFGCLFGIRDRFRANLYGLVVAILMAALAIMVRLAMWIPLFRVMQEVGQ